jgi:hypothetical protein
MVELSEITTTLIRAKAFFSDELKEHSTSLKNGSKNNNVHHLIYLGILINSLDIDLEDSVNNDQTQKIHSLLLKAIDAASIEQPMINTRIVIPNITIVSEGVSKATFDDAFDDLAVVFSDDLFDI